MLPATPGGQRGLRSPAMGKAQGSSPRVRRALRAHHLPAANSDFLPADDPSTLAFSSRYSDPGSFSRRVDAKATPSGSSNGKLPFAARIVRGLRLSRIGDAHGDTVAISVSVAGSLAGVGGGEGGVPAGMATLAKAPPFGSPAGKIFLVGWIFKPEPHSGGGPDTLWNPYRFDGASNTPFSLAYCIRSLDLAAIVLRF